MVDTPNGFVRYDLMTTDRNAAEAFYTDVVGWAAQDSGMPGVDYRILSAGTHRVAGLMTIPDEVRAAGGRPGWLGYVGVANIGAAVERLKAAGGRVHKMPADIPGVGQFAVVADPDGATFQLFQPAGSGEAPPSMMSPGSVGWHELYAGDGPAAFDFYAGQFGWTKAETMDMGPMGTYQLFAAGGMPIGGIMTKPPQVPAPFWGFYFAVPAIDAAIERVTSGGGQIIHGPMEVPGGAWVVQGLDPQGARFALVAPPRT